ncbi:plexin domain-containing 1-like protein [Labeo rohita]|uniref:Plexin domain-containing 1-like protein n=1 Tax=Labeo rohita TaxID=84645 RepID=A0A498LWJ7_LABRO|nr:plexin domain-containing 1-like protein [Labeo rohita]
MSEIKKGEKMEGENSEDCVIIDSGGIEGREGVNKSNSYCFQRRSYMPRASEKPTSARIPDGSQSVAQARGINHGESAKADGGPSDIQRIRRDQQDSSRRTQNRTEQEPTNRLSIDMLPDNMTRVVVS